jgi:peptidoglycan/xylan/chitin deacetylase (PgdA/CDA1 family)
MEQSTILKMVFDVLHYSGAAAALRPVFRGSGAIFCLHHVCPGGGAKTGFSPNYQLEVSPDFLNQVISHCVTRGYELISLGDAVERIKSRRKGGRPFAVFTLDDGYRDNAEYAAPVFRKHGCPYAVFVTSRIADGTCEIWWRALERILARSSSIEVNISGRTVNFALKTDLEKAQAWSEIFPAVKNMDEYEQRRWILALSEKHKFDLASYCRSVAMGWTEIAELSKDPLCTIGAHTVNHFALARLPRVDAYREIQDSRASITERLGRPVEFFAYPYGDHVAAARRDFELAERAGFSASVTTRKGMVHPDHWQHLQALPRVMLSGRYQNLRYVDTLLSGLPFALANRFRHVDAG